ANVADLGDQKQLGLCFFQALAEGSKSCGFRLRNRGQVLWFWGLRTSSEMVAKGAGLGAKSRSHCARRNAGWLLIKPVRCVRTSAGLCSGSESVRRRQGCSQQGAPGSREESRPAASGEPSLFPRGSKPRGGSLPVPFPRAEGRWGPPALLGRGRGGSTRCRRLLGTWQRGEKLGSELPRCPVQPRTAPLAESSPVFSPLAGWDKQVHFLPPFSPVSPPASREEKPGWVIAVAAQLDVNCHRFAVVALSCAMKVQEGWKESRAVCKYKVGLGHVSAFFPRH
ncbi:unnamed protein product, partial [Bubo scandiacus]